MDDIRTIVNDLDTTATRTVSAFRALYPCKLLAATWMQELAVDGAKTVKIRNETRTLDLTQQLTINGLGALGSAVFTVIPANADIRKGDVISIVYTVTTAGTVAPGESAVNMHTRIGPSGEII